MATHLLSLPELAPAQPDCSLRIDRHRCRFCGCRGTCPIPICKDQAGNYLLAFDQMATAVIQPGNWYIPGVCTTPTCVQLLIQESHEAARMGRMKKHG